MPTTYPTRTTRADRGSFMRAADLVVVAGPRSASSGELVGHDLHRGLQTCDAAIAALVGERVVRRGHFRPRLALQLVELRAQQVEVPGREPFQVVGAEEDEPLRDLVRHGRSAASHEVRHSGDYRETGG